MGTPTIDLSAGIVPAPPPPAPKPGGIDLSAGLVPAPPAAPSAPPTAAPAAAPDITANPNNEGVYRMVKGGKVVGIPYSNVPAAQNSGYGFDWSGKEGAGGEGERYGDDRQADPNRPQDSAEQFGRAFVGTARSHLGGAIQLLSKLEAHMASPYEVVNYKRDFPGATTEQAIAAIEGKDLNSQIAGPYKSQYRQDEEAELRKAAEWFKSNNQQEGVGGWLGAASENLAELLGPAELMKLAEAPAVAGDVVNAADKMQAGAKVANVLRNHPVINRLVGLGIRALKTGAESGAVAGGQTYVDTGGDTDQAAEAAVLGAAGGTALHAAGEGLPMAARAILGRLARPTTATDAVTDAAKAIVQDRLDATNATRTQPANALPASTGDFTFRIGGTPTAESTIGLRAGAPIEDADAGAPLLVDARKKQIGTRILPGKGPASGVMPQGGTPADYGITNTEGASAAAPADAGDPNARGSFRSPQFQFLDTPRPGTLQPRVETNTGGGTLETTDPKLAAAHLSNLKEAMADPAFAQLPPEQQAAIEAQHDDMQQQIVDYYKHQKATGTYTPNFQPVNTQAAVAATGDFGEAAKQLDPVGAEVYNHANAVTGNRWQALKDYITKTLPDQLAKEPYEEGRQAIRAEAARAQREMDAIYDDPRNGFDRTDANQAKNNFRAGFVLRDAADAIAPLYSIEEQTGRVTGSYRGVNGNYLGQRWQKFLDENRDARAIIGSDRADTLKRIFQQNETMAGRKRFGAAVANVAHTLGSGVAGYALGGMHGAIETPLAYQSIRYTLRALAANPKVAKNLLFAIDSGARPEQYAPTLARMIRSTVPAAAGGTVRTLNEDQGGSK